MELNFGEFLAWDIVSLLVIVARLALAGASGALIGFERGKHGRAAGMRTHMLVSIGAAVTSILGIYMTAHGFGDPSRIAAGVVSGIGFIGAGIILIKGSNKITGLTTAAAMWATAAVGLAYGAGYYVLAIPGTALIFIILSGMVYFENHQKKDYLFFIELEDAYRTNDVFKELKQMYPNSHSSDILPSKSGLPGHVGITINIHDDSKDKGVHMIEEIRKIKGVVFVVKE